MKSVLLSIKPKYCELIASGKKTVEIRKNRPKIDVPFKAYIYCAKNGSKIYGDGKCYITDNLNILNEEAEKEFEKTSEMRKWNGKVVGEFVCDWVNCINPLESDSVYYLLDSCLDAVEFIDYSGGKSCCAWHISDLVIYDKPKELSELYKPTMPKSYSDLDGLKRPPQSWCYVEELEE